MKFKELFSLYYERHAMVKNRCPQNTHYFFKAHGQRWGHLEVEEITRFDIQDWVDELGVSSRSAANRAVHMLSAVLNWGIRRGYIPGPNPCQGVEKFKIRDRDRFLMPEEFKRFRASLEQESQLYKDFFWMCLLTGARRGNVMSMRWDELDLELALWRFDSKNDEVCNLPLNTGALAILDRRSKTTSGPWVFPGRAQGKHLKEARRPWARILKRAGINNLRIHDLRRTLGSYLTINGENLAVVQKALGHKDQRSTAVYARLPLKSVRDAVEKVQFSFMSQENLPAVQAIHP